VEQPGFAGSRKEAEFIKGLEFAGGTDKGGKLAISPKMKEWFERHCSPIMLVHSSRFSSAKKSGA
jgi:hypothetical protein